MSGRVSLFEYIHTVYVFETIQHWRQAEGTTLSGASLSTVRPYAMQLLIYSRKLMSVAKLTHELSINVLQARVAVDMACFERSTALRHALCRG